MRVILGLIFVVHGWMKIQGMDMTVGFFGTLGLPAVVAYLVAAIEFLGGLAVLLGVFAQCASWLLALVMIGAVVMVKSGMGLVGGYELDLALLGLAVGVALIGPGKYSLKQ